MAKQPKFVAVQIPGRRLSWCVSVPPKMSETGARERRFFATKAEAKTFIDQTRVRVINEGTVTHGLTAVQRQAAAAAFKLMGDLPPTALIDIVHAHLEAKKLREKSVTFAKLGEAFLAAKAKRSEPYQRQMEAAFSKLEKLNGLNLHQVEPHKIEEQLKGSPPSSINAHLRVAKAAFNFAIKKGWLTVNPVKRLDFEEIVRDEVVVLTNVQVSALLQSCIDGDAELLPYHLFGMFAGIRPKELERMQWKDVRLDEKHILLPKGVTKGNYRRVVDMEETLVKWLTWFISNRGEQTGSITPQVNLRRRLRSCRNHAGILKWVSDVMRHTYASNWLAKFESADRLRANLGHRTSEVLLNHYHLAIPRKEADKFWAILPPEVSQSRTG